MQMEVMDRHPGGIAHVEGEAVAALPDSFDARHVFREHEHSGQHLGVVPLELAGAIDVNLRDDEAVDWCARIDVADSKGVLVLGNLLHLDFSTAHPAKEAVLHLHGGIVDVLRALCKTVNGLVQQALQTVYSSAMSEQRISVLSHFWAPLCAIGSRGPKGPNAQICVSVFGASIVPERPRLLVVLSKTNYTTELVAASGTFAVTVLAEAQAGLLEPLGLHSGREVSKLAGIAHTLTAMGDPAFGGAGSIACEVLRSFDFGDSRAFLAAVRDRTETAEPPLSWQTAKGIVGEDFLARWAAKSVREQAAAREAMAWRE